MKVFETKVTMDNVKINLIKPMTNSPFTIKEDEDMQKLVCEHIYDMAMLCNKPLGADAMTKFVERSNTILEKLI